MPTQQRFVAVNVRPESRDAMRGLMYRLSSETGERVSVSATMSAACEIAMRYINETVNAVTDASL
jgi:hypothetical protein